MLKNDMNAYGLNWFRLIKGWITGHTFFLVRLYRRGNWFYKHGIKVIPELIKKKMLRKYSCELSPYATIGKNFRIHHSVGIVVGHEVIIGDNCEIFQNVTIGSNRKERNGRYMPVIGDNVMIGSGAVVVGPITIGNNVRIGANAYVDKDVPDNTSVIGASARVLTERASKSSAITLQQ